MIESFLLDATGLKAHMLMKTCILVKQDGKVKTSVFGDKYSPSIPYTEQLSLCFLLI